MSNRPRRRKPTVFKRDGHWRVKQWLPDGKSATDPRQFRTRRQADDYAATLVSARLGGTAVNVARAGMLFEDWFEEWFEDVLIDNRDSTRDLKRRNFDSRILPQWGGWPLDTITQHDIQRWVTAMRREGLAYTTARMYYGHFRQAMNAAVTARVLPATPCTSINFGIDDTAEVPILPADSWWTIADMIEPCYRALVILDTYCALRIGEVCGLRGSQIDFEGGHVRVGSTRSIRGGKVYENDRAKTRAGEGRKVPLFDVVRAELIEHMQRYSVGPEDYLFTNVRGTGPLRDDLFRSRQWPRALDAAGLPYVKPHAMRHTGVSIWIKARVPDTEIVAWAGHRSVNYLKDTYGHVFADLESHSTAQVEAMFPARQTGGNVVRMKSRRGA